MWLIRRRSTSSDLAALPSLVLQSTPKTSKLTKSSLYTFSVSHRKDNVRSFVKVSKRYQRIYLDHQTPKTTSAQISNAAWYVLQMLILMLDGLDPLKTGYATWIGEKILNLKKGPSLRRRWWCKFQTNNNAPMSGLNNCLANKGRRDRIESLKRPHATFSRFRSRYLSGRCARADNSTEKRILLCSICSSPQAFPMLITLVIQTSFLGPYDVLSCPFSRCG